MSEKLGYKKLVLHDEFETGEKTHVNQDITDYGATDQEAPARPRKFLQTALIACLICCPIGIIALAHSLSVDRKFRQGDVEGAKRASELSQLHSQRAIGSAIILGGTVLLVLGSAILFAFIYCYDHYRYYGYA